MTRTPATPHNGKVHPVRKSPVFESIARRSKKTPLLGRPLVLVTSVHSKARWASRSVAKPFVSFNNFLLQFFFLFFALRLDYIFLSENLFPFSLSLLLVQLVLKINPLFIYCYCFSLRLLLWRLARVFLFLTLFLVLYFSFLSSRFDYIPLARTDTYFFLHICSSSSAWDYICVGLLGRRVLLTPGFTQRKCKERFSYHILHTYFPHEKKTTCFTRRSACLASALWLGVCHRYSTDCIILLKRCFLWEKVADEHAGCIIMLLEYYQREQNFSVRVSI